ncbi:MAG: hypothetical protein HOO96_40895 [Polyangiaceae bacterium]|nr:hypothetical protein [Polyangiaceae bacterium]
MTKPTLFACALLGMLQSACGREAKPPSASAPELEPTTMAQLLACDNRIGPGQRTRVDGELSAPLGGETLPRSATDAGAPPKLWSLTGHLEECFVLPAGHDEWKTGQRVSLTFEGVNCNLANLAYAGCRRQSVVAAAARP